MSGRKPQPYPGHVKATVSAKLGCKCRRFWAADATYSFEDNVGWLHTKKKCGPAAGERRER